MQGFFRTPQSEGLRHGLDLCSSSPSTGSSLGCQLQCSLPGHCCHWVLLLSSWCNQKADRLASSKRPPGACHCLPATKRTGQGFLRRRSECTPQSLPARQRSVAQQGNPCCSSSTPWRRTSSFRNLPHRRQNSRCCNQSS